MTYFLVIQSLIFRLFWKLFVSSYKGSSHEESKISPFSNLCPSYLSVKSKLQIHLANPTDPDILKVLIKIH